MNQIFDFNLKKLCLEIFRMDLYLFTEMEIDYHLFVQRYFGIVEKVKNKSRSSHAVSG